MNENDILLSSSVISWLCLLGISELRSGNQDKSLELGSSAAAGQTRMRGVTSDTADGGPEITEIIVLEDSLKKL